MHSAIKKTMLSTQILLALVAAAGVANAAEPGAATSDTPQPAPQGDQLVVTATAPDSTFNAGSDALVPAYLDGQIANGGRLGFLGEQKAENVPFSIVSYTSKLLQDQQAHTLSDVLDNDASVESSYGYGNFAENYVVRGFTLATDDISYGGLYGVLPRQIVSTFFAERVELLKGASAFLNGVPPGGTGVGGNVNIEPKRADDTPLTRVSLDYTSASQVGGSLDLARRFGEDNRVGVRVNLIHREGETAIDGEKRRLTGGSLGLDYRGDRFRGSLDVGAAHQTVHGGRPVVYTGSATRIPDAPSATTNYGQQWAYTDLETEFGMLKGEYDVAENWTVYGALGASHNHEYGKYSSPTLANDAGDTTMSRMTVPYFSDNVSGNTGIRGTFDTGVVSHRINIGYSNAYTKTRSAYTLTTASVSSNIYAPVAHTEPLVDRYAGGDMGDPHVRSRIRNQGYAISDTLSVLDERVQVIAGLRRQSIAVRNYGYDGVESGTFDETKVTPAFGLVLKPWDNVSFYANHIEALQAGESGATTYNGLRVSNGGQTAGIVTSKQDEVGVKADFGRVAASLALFEITKPESMYQLSGDHYDYGNYGEVRNRGLELNLFGEPVYGVRLNGSLTLLDPEMTKTQDGSYDGKDAVGVPRYHWVVSGEYDIPGLAGVTATGKVIRTGGQYADEANDLQLPAWTRLDLGVRYDMQRSENNIVWRAGVENVTNEHYWASAAGGYLTQGDPRELKLSMTVDF
ncbi:TonB-dependent siderophore receptor [Nissabacter archeti]|uniref:TonB-dependent siderophore receptor n=1 Tax=Nissabacter archeti TaxID=1917880 RepID=A0ABS5JCB2_9GAMM|nr:TonB-dependent siderophore receptor [Nissabacter archeti]MBS0967590.1 TonB-dependent siderophore receptor [Nissabacter archeti]